MVVIINFEMNYMLKCAHFTIHFPQNIFNVTAALFTLCDVDTEI